MDVAPIVENIISHLDTKWVFVRITYKYNIEKIPSVCSCISPISCVCTYFQSKSIIKIEVITTFKCTREQMPQQLVDYLLCCTNSLFARDAYKLMDDAMDGAFDRMRFIEKIDKSMRNDNHCVMITEKEVRYKNGVVNEILENHYMIVRDGDRVLKTLSSLLEQRV